jgi:transcription antitermination factor NusG
MPLDLTDNPVVAIRPQGCAGTTLRPRQPRGSRGIQWFVVRCLHRQEPAAVTHIAEQGFRAYCPLVATTRWNRHAHRERLTVLVPLFPSYAFTAFDRDADPWAPIKHTPGVLGIITTDTQPVPCPVGAVEALQAGEERRRSPTPPSALLRALDAVSVAAGPFRGHTGQIVGINRDRAVVTLMLFGRLQDVHVAVADLAPAGKLD